MPGPLSGRAGPSLALQMATGGTTLVAKSSREHVLGRFQGVEAGTDPARMAESSHPGMGRCEMVGATGFEPVTPCAQGRCATRLRYAPTSDLV